MLDFVNFLLTKVYQSEQIPDTLITKAFLQTQVDVNYHFPDIDSIGLKKRIQENENELALFLFRLGEQLHFNQLENLKFQIHWLLKELCSCEIYFNNKIDNGFYIVHGQGTVIGSRNIIGTGFKIHQGCTIGHKKNGSGTGNTIGNDVTMYCNSSILGEITVGNNVVIGAHVMVSKNITENSIILNK